MPSISSMLGLIGKLESPYVTVHQDRCVLVRNRNADCLRCAEVCTSGCIAFDGEELSLSPEKCIGCGTCATACPTCALEAHHPNDEQLMNECLSAAQHTDGLVTIACGELLDRAQGRVDGRKTVRVECLGRVEESALTQLVAQGVREVALVHGHCETCEHATGRTMAEQVLATERQLLEAWGRECPVRLSAKLPAQVRAESRDFDEARREAFKRSGDQAKQAGAAIAGAALGEALGTPDPSPDREQRRSYAKVMDDGTLPHFLPDRRERLLDALASLGEAREVLIDTRLWGHVIIDPEQCDSCRMCAVFCPTGALRKFDNEDGTFGVEHYPGDCVKCRCCTAICPTDALTLSEEVFASDMLEGMTDVYPMHEPAVRKGEAHAIWNTAKLLTNIAEVYER